MKLNWRSNTLGFVFNIIFWVFLFVFILAIRYYEIGNIAFINQNDIDIPLIRIYGNGSVLGVLVGIPYTLLEIYLKKKGLYKSSLGLIIIKRTLLQFIITALVLTLGAFVNFYVDQRDPLINTEHLVFTDYVFSVTVMFLFIGGFIGNTILSVFRTLHLKIGEDVFFELLGGKYKPAVEEDRTFLFLDLKSSTTIAEKLGHTKYSYFIQDCFIDLNPAITNSMASMYKYVGDEAILTWPTEIAIKNANCIKAFFNYRKQLQRRHSYYMETYGVFPEFKAGINAGLVMVAEVGVVKREIEYHGDVLNTAARIQGQCNDKNAWLLVSEVIKDSLPENHKYEIQLKGEVLLRGKSDAVNIYELLEK